MSPALEHAKYINLVTYRKDGREVSTPVWCVTLDGKLYFYTNGNLGKVKRIRATGRVKVAPSDARGKPLGPWSEGTGRIVTEADLLGRIFRALAAKYGVTYQVLNFFAWLARKQRERIAVELAI
jgi:PPOX class probable F420-dependent enzyme